MFSPRWLRKLPSLWLEFWLPLPLLGTLVWISGSWLAGEVLSRPYTTLSRLEADTELQIHLALRVLLIRAEIHTEQGFSLVEVQTADSHLRGLEFEFPVTDFEQLEAMIAQKLGLSIEDVRKLVRYQVG